MKKQCILCRVPNCHLAKEQAIVDCPINKFLKVLGGKRGMIVLLVLETPHRFGELKKNIPDITEKMLISTLKDLVRVWYVNKEKIIGKQLQSTYTISPLWKKALLIADSMADMGKLI
jgi:DNA-binding HxlR family transcriptional regulator